MPDPKATPEQQQPAFPSTTPRILDPAMIAAGNLGKIGSIASVPSTNAPPPAIARLYNSLDGGEIIKMMTRQIAAMLHRDRRLATNITFPRAMWHIRIDLVIQGREDPHVLFDLSGGHVELDENSVEYSQDSNKEVRITASGGQSYVDTPDNVREEHGINPPVARRHPWGSAETTTDLRQRVADLPPEYVKGKEAVEQMKRSNPMKARRLSEALAGRPHVIVQESPMANKARVITPYDDSYGPVEEPTPATAESPFPQELRGSRHREDAVDPRSNVPDDPRFHMESLQPVLDAEEKAITRGKDSFDPSVLDLREQPLARSGSIKDSEGVPNAEMVAKAAAQRDRGAPPANREVKMQPDSIEAENPNAVSSRQETPEVDIEVDVSDDLAPDPIEPSSMKGR